MDSFSNRSDDYISTLGNNLAKYLNSKRDISYRNSSF